MDTDMTILKLKLVNWLFIIASVFIANTIYAKGTIPLTVHNVIEGAPITLGVPFPQGVLMSPDHVRLLDDNGKEIPCQTTQVTSWEPLDYSVKWMWVFFFATDDENYTLEYGPDVIKAPIIGDRIKIKNGQRGGQTSMVDTGPLRFSISKRGGGFIDNVLLDVDNNGFDDRDTIVKNEFARGSFLDLLDDLGVDSSKAVIHRSFRERGSGPLHAILRLEGEYTYNRSDNRESPFIIRIHVYAGKSYVRVYHTMTYTGVPDKSQQRQGQHENIATTLNVNIFDDSKTADEGWMKANDQIAGIGLDLDFRLGENLKYLCGYKDGTWENNGKEKIVESELSDNALLSVFQNGPKPDRIPPVPSSSLEERLDGFNASISETNIKKKQFERASGWTDVTGDKCGVSIGIRHFLEEYPKEITYSCGSDTGTAYLWSPKGGPMSFARSSLDRDQGMIANFAEGITKTSELVFHFHNKDLKERNIVNTMTYFLDPPIAHAGAETYANSKVYGSFAPYDKKSASFERALEYKFDWQIFNQHWEPWYGMFDYGDQKNYFFREDWFRWQNNEPAIDYMYWLQFMRTGDPKYYKAADAMSKHTMDVDNVHWPAEPKYYGTTNESLDFFKYENRERKANPYLGVGRRHAKQHWSALLSAHVWLEGWIASYYLTGYHRGLDVARLTADSHTRRIWGEHGLTGRRLYLSTWNLIETWDATKDPKYLTDLEDRVDRIINLQNGPDQYDNLVIDRYGYSQVYASHAMYKYYQITRDERVRQSLIRHARAVRDNPPYNHEYESYFASIHSLVLGYEFTQEASFINEARYRAQKLKVPKMKKSFKKLGTQKAIAEALDNISNLPDMGDFETRRRWVTNWSPTSGLRVFGWTHIYNIPWLLYWIDEE